MWKKIKPWLLGSSGLLALYLIGVLSYGTLNDYQPEQERVLIPINKTQEAVIQDSILSFLSWNIGYGGLGAEADFFFDQGKLLFSGDGMIHSEPEMVEQYIKGIRQKLTSVKSDFFLLQEVDYHSKRSYYNNEFEIISKDLPDFSGVFTDNYKSPTVAIPVMEPWHFYGEVLSGLGTWSRFTSTNNRRLQLPGDFPWPTRIFQLDRCLLVQEYEVKGGKKLTLINLHNSAYDKTGEIKAQQMNYVKDLAQAKYKEGHYVVVGGDWNQCPPNFPFNRFSPNYKGDNFQTNIAPEFMPSDWQWIYDPTLPTNRKLQAPYVPGKTFVTTIDFFLISPNLQVQTVKVLDEGFANSDHQAVWMEVLLNP